MAQNIRINGVTYSDVPYISIPLAEGNDDAAFYDTTDADAAAGDVLSGKTFFGANGSVNGSMTNNGAVSRELSTPNDSYTIPQGYHNGSGTVTLKPSEAAKLVSGNIKSGVTMFGVSGSSNVVDTSDADAAAAHILSGKTAYVGGAKVTGSMTTATVSQDSTTKVVSIA